MPEYLRPGLYVEEKKFNTQPPVSAGTLTVGAFVGHAPRGKRLDPFLVTSWADYVSKVADGVDSPFMANAYLSYAVFGFFQNGGQQAWIVLCDDGTSKAATLSLPNGTTPIVVNAKDPGAWGNKISFKIVKNAEDDTLYDFEVYRDSSLLERFPKVGLTAGVARKLDTVVNAESRYVSITTTAVTIDASSIDSVKVLATGTDGVSGMTDVLYNTAISKLDVVDRIDLLVVPESQATAVIQNAYAYAEKRRAFLVADGAQNDSIATVQTLKSSLSSDFGSLYYPWIEVADPIGGAKKSKYVPCAGHVAGFIARNDSQRGIFKAPAGDSAKLIGALSVKTKVNDEDHKVLNPKNINVIRVFSDVGIVVYGAKTLNGSYINQRRELSFVMNEVPRMTRWAAFEPNDAELWRKIRNQILTMLEQRRIDGAYKGSGEGSSYFVKCDEEINTPAVQEAGQVLTEIGIATKKPGEFIIFRVGQWEGGSTVQ